MKNKTLEFALEIAITTPIYYAGGFAGAEIADLVADSEVLITTGSTIGELSLGWSSLLALHAWKKKIGYVKEQGSRFAQIMQYGLSKLLPPVAVAEASYLTTRSVLMWYLQKEGQDPGMASLTADALSTPLYFGAAIGYAKKFGFLRKEN
jgi:hypothetical protein